VVEMSEEQGTTQDGTKTSYQREELRFSFEGKQAGDYLLAFILHKIASLQMRAGKHLMLSLVSEPSTTPIPLMRERARRASRKHADNCDSGLVIRHSSPRRTSFMVSC
jgi:hypothetical protein